MDGWKERRKERKKEGGRKEGRKERKPARKQILNLICQSPITKTERIKGPWSRNTVFTSEHSSLIFYLLPAAFLSD